MCTSRSATSPEANYLGQVTSDLIIHTWDLARGLGIDDGLKPALVMFVEEFLGPRMEAWRKGGAFAAAVDAGPDASARDRLLAQTGRSPSWNADGR